MEMSRLHYMVLEALTRQDELDPAIARLINAAFSSAQELEFALKSTQELDEKSHVEEDVPEVPKAFLKKVEVTGFRGVGPKTVVHFHPGPGLTLVVGRNGSGKSSIAEALEVVLTGDSFRWSNRSAKTDWLRGWKNLHSAARPTVSATLLINGQPAPLEIKRQWEDDADHHQSTLSVKHLKDEEPDFSEVGWKDAVTTFRPLLSYNELGAQLDKGPASLFDSLDAVLGLDELTKVKGLLADARKKREAHAKAAKTAKAEAKALAEKSDDPRADEALKLLKSRKPNLEDVEALIEGEPEDESRLQKLKSAAQLKCPPADRVLEAAENLREALKHLESLEGTQVAIDTEAASLILGAIKVVERTQNESCPVCQVGKLDAAWIEEAKTKLKSMEDQKNQMASARAALRMAASDAQMLVGQASTLPAGLELGLLEVAAKALQAWKELPAERELPLHLETRFDALQAAYQAVRDEAQSILQTLETQWRPVKKALGAFVDASREAQTVDEDIQALKDSENWLLAFEDQVRQERFAPIAARTQEIWDLLKQQSNISLEDIKLTGKGTKRKVDMKVNVDDQEAVALGVMSQGELHSLLLSLFLPRLTLDESPFSFVVLDDPVQAMDPAKVDGLARVLEDTAKTHQVIVFTHDTRLVDAVRRLRIPAHIKSVSRQKRSRVSVESTKSPAWQLIEDALNIASNSDQMAPRIAQRVVPGLCRGALELAFKEMAWETMLNNGVSHQECETRINTAKKTLDLARLALFGDNVATDPYQTLDNKYHRRVSGPLRTTIKHAHEPYAGDLNLLIEDTKAALKELGAT